MDEFIKVIILGIVEGITEFLPVSSTGHLIVAASILNLSPELRGTFEIFIQLGAVIAVLFFYHADLWNQARSFTKDDTVRKLWIAIVIAAVPAAIVGFLLRDFIKAVLFNPVVVALSLIIGGIIFVIIERPRPTERPISTHDLGQITIRQAVFVGLLQSIALIPGVSRSGASIIGGMLAGMSREAATRFSFYLAIPVLGGATVIELLTELDTFSSEQLAYLFVGALVSAVIAWISIGWLLRFVARNTFAGFGYYRIVAGLVILAMAAAGWLQSI